jgi:LPS export ABC transporter protein LptC
MKNNNRPLQSIILVAVVGFFSFSACNNKASRHELQNWAKQLDSLSVEIAHNVEVVYTDSGRLKAIIEAPIMEHHNDPKRPFTEMKEGVKAVFYDASGVEESNLRADYAINYERKKIIHLKKNVHVTNSIGEELSSEELFWDQKSREIYTEKQVTIKRGEELIIGRGLRSNETFTKYRIERPSGTVNVPEQ